MLRVGWARPPVTTWGRTSARSRGGSRGHRAPSRRRWRGGGLQLLAEPLDQFLQPERHRLHVDVLGGRHRQVRAAARRRRGRRTRRRTRSRSAARSVCGSPQNSAVLRASDCSPDIPAACRSASSTLIRSECAISSPSAESRMACRVSGIFRASSSIQPSLLVAASFMPAIPLRSRAGRWRGRIGCHAARRRARRRSGGPGCRTGSAGTGAARARARRAGDGRRARLRAAAVLAETRRRRGRPPAVSDGSCAAAAGAGSSRSPALARRRCARAVRRVGRGAVRRRLRRGSAASLRQEDHGPHPAVRRARVHRDA